MRLYVVRQVDGVQSVDADEQYMFDLVADAAVGVGRG